MRPEKIALGAADAAPNRLDGVLIDSAYLGARSHLRVRVEGLPEPIAVAAQNAPPPAHGEVALSFPPDAVVVLSQE